MSWYLLLLIPTLIHTAIASNMHTSAINLKTPGLIWAYLFFGLISAVWFYVKENKKLNISSIMYMVALIGSMIWSYQPGYYVLKALFPVLLFTVVNKKKVVGTSVFDLIIAYLPLIFFPPFFLYRVYVTFKNSKEKANKATEKRWFALPLLLGLGGGLFVMILLAAIDPGFSKFIGNWFNYFKYFFQSLVYYVFAFVYFIYMPTKAYWKPEVKIPPLKSMLQTAVFLMTTIIVGYSIYNSYIFLRAYEKVKFYFDSMGKNTRMEFLELVILGSFWLFASSYILSKLTNYLKSKETEKKDRSVTKTYLYLALSLLWLVPPLWNVYRVLFLVYLPKFGLTATRLFGVFTLLAFIVSFIKTYILIIRKKDTIFVCSVLSFFLVLSVLAFALPNNAIIYNWHFDKYIKGENTDYKYLHKLKLENEAEWFINRLEGDKYISDNHMALILLKNTKVKQEERARVYITRLQRAVRLDILNIKKLLTDQKFENLVNEYVYEGSKYYVYKGEKLSNVYSISENLNQVEKEHENFIKRVLNNEHIYWSDMYEFNVYRGIDFASTTNWNPNNTYLNSSMVKYADNYNNSTYFKLNFNRKVNSAILIASNFEPFWYKELKASCKETSCNYNNFLSLTYALRKSGIISLENKTIPDELVKRYIDAYWKTVNGSVQSR